MPSRSNEIHVKNLVFLIFNTKKKTNENTWNFWNWSFISCSELFVYFQWKKMNDSSHGEQNFFEVTLEREKKLSESSDCSISKIKSDLKCFVFSNSNVSLQTSPLTCRRERRRSRCLKEKIWNVRFFQHSNLA